MPSEHLYVVSSTRAKSVTEDQLLSMPDADDQGRVLFRAPLEKDKFTETLNAYIQATKIALEKASSLVAGYRVEEIKLSLGVDAAVGCIFVGEGKAEASIEVTIKRI